MGGKDATLVLSGERKTKLGEAQQGVMRGTDMG